MSRHAVPPLLDGFDRVKHLGDGQTGAAYEERDKATGEVVAVKYILRTQVRGPRCARCAGRCAVVHSHAPAAPPPLAPRLVPAWPTAHVLVRLRHALACARLPQVTDKSSRELLNHYLLVHPNIVGFRRALLTPAHLCIVMELTQHGDLIQFVLAQREKRASEAQARAAVAQILAAVQHAHAAGIAHRDLKARSRDAGWPCAARCAALKHAAPHRARSCATRCWRRRPRPAACLW
jgi:serine/threonine protein kinase